MKNYLLAAALLAGGCSRVNDVDLHPFRVFGPVLAHIAACTGTQEAIPFSRAGDTIRSRSISAAVLFPVGHEYVRAELYHRTHMGRRFEIALTVNRDAGLPEVEFAQKVPSCAASYPDAVVEVSINDVDQ